jgi:hypothetical protein
VIIRPNGKPYQPVKIRAVCWKHEYERGVIVIGTHDVALAHPMAVEACRSFHGCEHAINPERGWVRDSFYRGERSWDHDPVRGAACVMFTASDDPEEEI